MFATLVDAPTLHAHMRDPDWAVFDCRFDLEDPDAGEGAYLRGHIPGAVYVHLDRALCAPRTGRNGRHPLPPTDLLAETFARLGIDEHVQVIAYDDRGGGFAARLWWSLRYLGHPASAVLDGGIQAWIEAGFPLTTDPERRSRRTFVPRPRPDRLVTLEDLLGAQDLLLIDSRSRERYLGEEEPLDPVAGHIPGARNRFWGTNLDPQGRFRSPESLRRSWRRLLGTRDSAQAIVYCGSGVTGCHNILSMVHAGLHEPRLYAGSWSEWCSDPARPIATGEEPPLSDG